MLTQAALDAFCQKYHIPDVVHHEFYAPNQSIHDSPADVLGYFRINLSHLFVIVAAKVSHFGILCRVHGYVPTVGLFRRFCVNSKHKEMDLFAFIHHADPTKVWIGERHIEEEQVPLLESTRVVLFLWSCFEQSTLNVDVGVSAAATMPFVTSFVTLTPERECGDNTDSIFGPNLWTQRLAKRFVISSDSSHHSSTNDADVKVTSVVRSSASTPPLMTAAVATTAIAGVTFASVLRVGTEPVHASMFANFASIGEVGQDITGLSNHDRTELSADTFYVSHEMGYETLQQVYVPKWNVINDSCLDDPELFAEFNVEVARQPCFSAEVRLRSEHNYRERKKFERKCQRQTDLLKEKVDEIASLKAQLSLKEAEAMEVIHLLLEEEKGVLDGKVMTLESAAVAKETELTSLTTQTAKLTQDLSNLQLSFDELSIKASSLESQKDNLADQEHYEAVQDEHVKVISNRLTGLDTELMGMALHLDEEFYPRFLTTIDSQRWIIICGFRLAVMKCFQSPEYVIALGTAIGVTPPNWVSVE
nr:transposase (putative), gypsy type [Tanacetum cinerariifolium]